MHEKVTGELMAKAIQIDRLPESARNELYDFYEFLMSKYTPSVKRSRSVNGTKTAFFRKVSTLSFTLPSNYRFDRNELHER